MTIWQWWACMFAAGLILGCAGAWAPGVYRVLLKTLGAPAVLAVTRIAWPHLLPVKNTPLTLFADLILIAAGALLGDYVLGLKLRRHDRSGYRTN